ncbi:acyl-CoA N-acyltransferase [Lyophyllum atratum]|nr:acyl-CoA N-acyltransferase [Lyophyllum atratum]
MPAYCVSTVPRPPSEAYITNYSAIRLLGLQRDEHAFGSIYERELKFTRDQWRERLDASDRTTFFIRAENPSDHGLESEENWVGTASFLTPDFLEALGFFPPKHLVRDDKAVCILVGMWIHTEHRRRGLGRRLIEAIIEKVRSDDGRASRKVLMLQVHENNAEARGLYESLGFVNDGPGDDDDSPGEIWMSFCLDGREGI